ncbi:hypothetical protein [Mitsuaria sp. GD03876]|uniref:hypothetical protein n=1 Tax=Mitsuaria sp. GD03876 TaxID=2975399 RepID=UPI00244D626C|nr:hypothetical protein [Mitsuaria sp. GD03876]MDH0866404.1 hypothetical protein [Mitsuaria sp. GD03876]
MNRFLMSVLVGLAAWNLSTAWLIDLYVPSPCNALGRCDGDMAFTLKVVGIWFGMFWLTSVTVLLYNIARWKRDWQRHQRQWR